MPHLKLEVLDKTKHDRKRFSCGIDSLDSYLHNYARQNQDACTAVCHVFVRAERPERIVGYFTLSQHAVDPGSEHEALFREQPRIARTVAVPTTLIGRLAIDRDFQGERLGEALLVEALRTALTASQKVASAAVLVDPNSASARQFYEKFGFRLLNQESGRLFITMDTVAHNFSRATQPVDREEAASVHDVP